MTATEGGNPYIVSSTAAAEGGNPYIVPLTAAAGTAAARPKPRRRSPLRPPQLGVHIQEVVVNTPLSEFYPELSWPDWDLRAASAPLGALRAGNWGGRLAQPAATSNIGQLGVTSG